MVVHWEAGVDYRAEEQKYEEDSICTHILLQTLVPLLFQTLVPAC